MRLSQERQPKGSRKHVRLVEAVILGLPALWASWEAPSVPMWNSGLMVLELALAVATGLLLRSWWYRSPFDIPTRLPRRLSTWPCVRWLCRPFLGWTRSRLGIPRFAFGTAEDSVGVVGPSGVAKTLGVAVPQALFWAGPFVSISQTPLVFRQTVARRCMLANDHGGRVYVYAPTEHDQSRIEGFEPIHFSPASSTDPTVVRLRVNSWIEAAKTAKGTDDADHWRAGAARILRGVFLACAHHRIRPGDFRLVREWIAARDLAEPIQILTDLRSFAGDQWADELKGIQNTPEREKGSFFSAAENTIDATADPAVLKSTMRTDLDFERFLGTRSTLYVMSPTEHQRSVSPLISMLVETLAHTAYRMHREGRLPARFAISEDDLANVAPLPGLESMISQGRGQGLTVFWNLQSLAQLAEHYGDRAAEAIWSATRCKIVFGGLADERSVERLSNLIPEEPVVVPGESMTEKGPKGSKHTTYRRLLSAAQLREIPDGWALLLYHNLSPRMLRQPLAVKRFVLSRHIVPWAAVAGRLGAATRAAEAEPVLEV